VLFGWHRHARIDFAEQCKGCKKCVITCPNQAIIYTYVPTKKQPE
jgi:Fe-S-cluster-containing hydrogenase component 2